MKFCIKEKCNQIGTHKINSYGTLYCDKHYRFFKMAVKAKDKNQYAPSYKELENLLNKLSNMECPICDKIMIWHKKYGSLSDVISLQHNNDGNLLLICQGCNAGHGSSKIGDKYLDLKKNEKYCTNCKNILDKKLFYEYHGQLYSYCKICSNDYYNSRQLRNRINGKCAYCDNKLSDKSKWRCDICLEKQRIAIKKFRRNKKCVC